MNIELLGCFAILSYAVASVLMVRECAAALGHRYSMVFAWLAVVLHATHAQLQFLQLGAVDFGFYSAASMVALVVTLVLLLAALDKPVAKLGVGVFPVAGVILSLSLIFAKPAHPLAAHGWPMTIHILASIMAFSLFSIGSVQAIFLAIQDRQLRGHHPRRLALVLPPLQAMESLLFQMLVAGMVFLSVSLISGFVFIDDLFAQHLVHKTVLSIAAWFIFGGLLIGRLVLGWRGQTAINWTLVGFTALLLAYFGSKMVLELVLNKV